MSAIGTEPVRMRPTRIFARPDAYTAALAAILLVAAALRIAGASSELWLDEIWSLQNLAGLRNVGDIFWGISEDNNHFLNSLWLWFTGPDAPPLEQRAASIVFGIASVAMAARITGRAAGQVGALIGATLFATSYVFVHYGSEARGYSTMIFGVLWAYDALVRWVEDPAYDRPRCEFALAVAIGALGQLTMVPAAGLLAAGAAILIGLQAKSLRATLHASVRVGSALILGVAPVGLAIGAGVLNTHVLRLGDQHPFTVQNWLGGLSGVVGATFSTPICLGTPLTILLAIVVAAIASTIVQPSQRILAGALVFALPAVEALAQLPNLHFARFHLAFAIGLALTFAQATAWLCMQGRASRVAAGFIVVAYLAATTTSLVPFLRDGRGDYARAVRRMGDATFATIAVSGVTTRVARFYGEREHVRLTHTPIRTCTDPKPDWFILAEDFQQPLPSSPTFDVGPNGCRTAYALVDVFPYWGLSGFRWTLYRHPIEPNPRRHETATSLSADEPAAPQQDTIR